MQWNVFYYNCNKRKIETYNIFDHGTFRKYVEEHLKECIEKEEFSEKLRRELFYYFSSKCEWEIVITSWPTRITMNELDRVNTERKKAIKEYSKEPYSLYVNPEVSKKIDIYDQVMSNFNIFLDYVWSNKKML